MKPIHQNEIIPFDMIYTSLIGIQYHPRSASEPTSRLTLEECRDLAHKAVLVRRSIVENTAEGAFRNENED